MRIRDFRCKNYKNLRDVSMAEVPNLLVLIGINSSGKSNLLEALALVLQNFGAEPSRNIGAVNDNLFWNQQPNLHPVTLDMHVELTQEDLEFLNAGSPLPGVPTQPPFMLHITKVLVARQGSMFWETRTADFLPSVSEASSEAKPQDFPPPALLAKLDTLFKQSFSSVPAIREASAPGQPFVDRAPLIPPQSVSEMWTVSQATGGKRKTWTDTARDFQRLAPSAYQVEPASSSFHISDGRVSVPMGNDGGGNQALLYLMNKIRSSNQILTIEEPENHMHPGQVKKLGAYLTNEAVQDKQIIVVTHSNALLNQIPLDNVAVVRRGTNGAEVNRIVDREQLKILFAELGLRRADLLGMNAIVLVDGMSDEVFYSALAQTAKVGLATSNIEIIAANGSQRGTGKIELWAEAASDIGLPVYVLQDKDAKSTVEKLISQKKLDRRNVHVLQRGALEDYYPWVLLKPSLQEVFGKEPGEELVSGNRVRNIAEFGERSPKDGRWKVELAREVAARLETATEFLEDEFGEQLQFMRRIVVNVAV